MRTIFHYDYTIVYFILINQQTGLFHRAISQSGTIFNQWALREYPVKQAYRFGNRLNCSTTSVEDLTLCLMLIDPARIAESQKEAGVRKETACPLTILDKIQLSCFVS